MNPGDHSDYVIGTRPRDGIAVLTLNRPQARNALVLESWEALRTHLDKLRTTAAHLRAVVLTGAGGYFSAGGDLKVPPASGSGATASVGRLEIAHEVLGLVGRLSCPVIAAVEGGAAGLGWSLALACDLIVTSATACFSAPFGRLGVVPDGGAAWHLTRGLGRYRAADLVFTGRPMTGDEALNVGLANRLAPEGLVLETAIELGVSLPVTPHALELTKRAVRDAQENSLAQFVTVEVMMAALCQLGDEVAIARRAFSTTRRPS